MYGRHALFSFSRQPITFEGEDGGNDHRRRDDALLTPDDPFGGAVGNCLSIDGEAMRHAKTLLIPVRKL
jgi:hypothetical protein